MADFKKYAFIFEKFMRIEATLRRLVPHFLEFQHDKN